MRLEHILAETVKKCGNQWCVYSKREKKLLGKHPSKKKAHKQLTAIEISKLSK